jgi:hypothetical protein
MRDIDEAVCGLDHEWLLLVAADAAHHEESDDVAFERWLASLPEEGADALLGGLLDVRQSFGASPPTPA